MASPRPIGIPIKMTLLFCSMMTMMAGAAIAPTLPQISRHFDSIPNVILLTQFIITLPALFIAIISPFTGRLIDSFGRTRILLLSLILYAIAGFSGFWLENFYLILVGRILLGFSVSGIMTATLTLIGDYFEGEARGAFLGFQGAFMSLGGAVFISASGVLADIGWHWPFIVYLFAAPVAILVAALLFEPETFGDKAIADGLSSTQYDKGLLVIINGIVFCGVLIFFLVPVQTPYLLSKLPNISNTAVGLAMTSTTLASAFVSINYRHIKRYLSFPLIYIGAFGFIGIGYILVSLSASYAAIIFGLVFAGCGVGLLMPSGSLWIMFVTPLAYRGRILGIAGTMMFLGQFISPLLVRPLSAASSLRGAFMIVGIISLLVVLVLAVFTKRLDARTQKAHENLEISR